MELEYGKYAAAILIEAWVTARRRGATPEAFAVELVVLRESISFIRAAVRDGLVDHWVRDSDGVCTRPVSCIDQFSIDSVFCLNAKGANVLVEKPAPQPGVPQWDRVAGELVFCGKLVKRFERRAGNQRLVLDVFQEEGWPRYIDDPLSPTDTCSMTRLRETIKSLNSRHCSSIMRFRSNGQGTGVAWFTNDSSAVLIESQEMAYSRYGPISAISH